MSDFEYFLVQSDVDVTVAGEYTIGWELTKRVAKTMIANSPLEVKVSMAWWPSEV